MAGPGAARGTFITFEGPEGAGKSSQLVRLAAALVGDGVDVLATREPGGTPLGERIRSLLLETGSTIPAPWTDALLFNAARAALVGEVIAPALDDGRVVLCDRFADSTVAYQGFGSGLPLEELRAVERLATGGLVPDLTILLDLPAREGLRRKSGEETRFETEFDLAFHERVRAGFLTLAAGEPGRYVIVDAGRAQEAVAADVIRAVRSRLAGGQVPAGAPTDEPNRPLARTRG